MEFRLAARRISSEMTALTEIISGEQGSRTSQALGRILEHSRVMDARAEAGSQALARVQELAGRIPLAFSELGNRVMLFRTLCTLTRIETSLLGTACDGFEGLTETVKPLSESIHVSGGRVLNIAVQMDQHIQEALQLGFDLQSRQLSELRSLIDGIMDSLRSFEQRRLQAQEATIRQAADHEKMCQALDNLVQSLQFHDITRQQIEHVIGSLRQVRSLPADDGQNSAVVRLQSRQLAGAESVFASSVSAIRLGLSEIAAGVLDMSETSSALVGLSSREEDSFFQKMERGCAAILETITVCSCDSSRIRTMVDELEATIGEMRQSVAEIQGIEIQIKRIALNAAIKAAHIAGTTNALNAIAETMQRLVADSSGDTQSAAIALDSMSAAVHVIACEDKEGPDTAAGADGILTEVQTAIAALHAALHGYSTASLDRVNQISAVSVELGGAVGTILADFTVGDVFANVVARVRSELDSLGGQSSDAAEISLDTFAAHYTMQSERDVHDGVIASPVVVESEGLPDNVELF
jgi:methyl-accepting chemotaxis protein